MHGKGELIGTDGWTYEGTFKENLMHGYGTLKAPKDDITIQYAQIKGKWDDNKLMIIDQVVENPNYVETSPSL